MNRSFENIFEKFNITCNLPRKRQKSSKTPTQLFTFLKNEQTFSRKRSALLPKNDCSTENVLANLKTSNSESNTTTNLNSNTSYYLNKSAKKKYFCATRYNTLEVVRFENASERPYSSTTESFTSNENINTSTGECCRKGYSVSKTIEKERNNLTKSEFSSEIIGCDNTESSNHLRRGFNVMKYQQGCRNRIQTHYLRYNKLNISIKEKKGKDFIKEQSNNKCMTSDAAETFNNDLLQSFENSSQQPSQIIDTPTLTPQSVDNVSTELDLLIDLIEYEDRNRARRESHKQKYNSNCNDVLPKSKSRLKGGYEELFERALKRETVRGNFLKHDRKIGLRTGKLFTVVKMDSFYGLTIATVKSEDLHKNVGLVVTQEMVPLLKLGSQIEAFFDDKTLPYKLHFHGDYLEVYLQPYKLLVVPMNGFDV